MLEHFDRHLGDETIQAYLDAALPEADRAQIDSHLHACEECQDRVAACRRLFAAIKAIPELPLERDLAPSVIQAIGREKRKHLLLRIGLPSAEALSLAILLLTAWRFIGSGLQILRSTTLGILTGVALVPGRLLLLPAIAWPRWTGMPRLDHLDFRVASLPGLLTPAALTAGAVVWIAGNWLLLRRQGVGNGHGE